MSKPKSKLLSFLKNLTIENAFITKKSQPLKRIVWTMTSYICLIIQKKNFWAFGEIAQYMQYWSILILQRNLKLKRGIILLY